ncbi:MAG: hypothetical protein BAJALOKI2v1_310021 [Promethearchaeota archaeon]|nr:MAG: hypothetical protein BAJALOKI2v1_310021 [Candidatus Lokiarchaeota archaeon]
MASNIVIPEKIINEVSEYLEDPIKSQTIELLEDIRIQKNEFPNEILLNKIKSLLVQLDHLDNNDLFEFLAILRKRLINSEDLSNDEKLSLCQVERRVMNHYLKRLIKKHEIS